MRMQRRAAESDAVQSDRAVAFRPRCGDSVGAWRLCEPLGSGGSASVWRAEGPDGGSVALKFLRPAYAALARHEHGVLAAVRHPNVVATHGLAAVPSGAALVLDYLPGGDFVALAGGPVARVLEALRGVVAALCATHARGYAHCDVKARNVLFAADDTPRLIDFAAARPLDAPLRRDAATAAATPVGASSSGRTADAFAFAALVYEALTGVLPYGANGARWVGELPRPVPASSPAVAALLGRATDVLRSGGRAPEALRTLAHDIESALLAMAG